MTTASERLHLPLAGASSETRLELSRAVEVSDDALLQVGELAKAACKTVRAIHLYEELGLLTPHARSKGKYRLFGPEALVRVRWIGKMQDLGLSLGEIQAIAGSWEGAHSASGAMRQVRETYRAKLEATRAQIARLQALEGELAASMAYLETCDTSCDPVRSREACPSCELHPVDREAPELVAGVRAGRTVEACGRALRDPER